MTTLAQFNRLPPDAARDLMLRCCASARWAGRMAAARPYASLEHLAEAADDHWRAMARRDHLEAFRGHPVIGRPHDPAGGDDAARAMAAKEQAAVAGAGSEVTASLARLNRDYADKFGFIFIVCAGGKSAEQMLALLRARIHNTRDEELANAAEEQRKITRLRIHKLFAKP